MDTEETFPKKRHSLLKCKGSPPSPPYRVVAWRTHVFSLVVRRWLVHLRFAVKLTAAFEKPQRVWAFCGRSADAHRLLPAKGFLVAWRAAVRKNLLLSKEKRFSWTLES